MGQAKQRGSFEDRKRRAEEAKREEEGLLSQEDKDAWDRLGRLLGRGKEYAGTGTIAIDGCNDDLTDFGDIFGDESSSHNYSNDPIIVPPDDWFEEKVRQVESCPASAFGIDLFSDHDNANEIISMLQLAQALAQNDLEKHVEELNYDSENCICDIKFGPMIGDGDPITRKVRDIACKYLPQFLIFDCVEHGCDLIDLES